MITMIVSANYWKNTEDWKDNIWDHWKSDIQLPVVPRVGEVIKMLFGSDYKTREIKITEVKYVQASYVNSFEIVLSGHEVKTLPVKQQ